MTLKLEFTLEKTAAVVERVDRLREEASKGGFLNLQILLDLEEAEVAVARAYAEETASINHPETVVALTQSESGWEFIRKMVAIWKVSEA